MADCAVCGSSDSMPYTCRRCSLQFCSSHRLPEKHSCPGLAAEQTSQKWFRDYSQRSPEEDDRWKSKSTPKKPNLEGESDGTSLGKSITGALFRIRRAFVYAIPVLGSISVLAVLVVGGALYGGVLAPGDLPVGSDVASSFDASYGGTNETATGGTREESTPESDGGLLGGESEVNRTEVEYAIHAEINEVRRDRGLSTLSFDTELRRPARYHSEDMAEEGYFAHEAPDGGTFGDRYEKFGYTCRVDAGGNRYATGGENIAQTWFEERIRTDGGTEYYGNTSELAEGIVEQWMNSPGHRKNILRPYWENEALGVYLTGKDGKTAVYATQNFC